MKIVVKKGLDIPLDGKPEGLVLPLSSPKHIALNLEPFSDLRFKVLVQVGDRVKIGTPLVENKAQPGQFFAAPACGVVTEIRRGLKRRLTDIVIERDEKEEYEKHGSLGENASREEILAHLLKGGIFPHIRQRPFDVIASAEVTPRAIFVSALESLPFAPSAEMQVKGHERNFQAGLKALSKLTTGSVHLVYRENTPSTAFSQAQDVEKHTVIGPHPASTSSLHIQSIDRIRHGRDYVWTLSTDAVIAVGKMVLEGQYLEKRVLSIAGNGILQAKRGFFEGRLGLPIAFLLENRLEKEPLRLISGDPLLGHAVTENDFLHFYHKTCCALFENDTREPFHFLGLGRMKYSATRAYASGHLSAPKEGYRFTTNQHGEERPFVDAAVYEKVMPLQIPTMQLVKAILTDNFELAEILGIFEIASEDFALPTFICPSKIEMVEIVEQGLSRYAKEH